MTSRPSYLGINAFHGDAAAAILGGGGLIAAVEEERFRRLKHWAGFPARAIEYCLEAADRSLEEVEGIAVSRRPSAHLSRKALLALTHPRSLPRALARARNLAQIGSLEERLKRDFGGAGVAVHGVEHHLAHAASAFLCSPWDEAMCLTVDGFGDFTSTMLAVGRGTSIEVLDRVYFPHSLGLFYTALTQYLGFPKYGDEYKVMGLAAFGEPSLTAELEEVVPAIADGSFRLDMRYFRHLRDGVDMTWDDGEPTLGPVYSSALETALGPSRRPEDPLTDRHKDLAASLQEVYERRLFALVRELQRRTGLSRLVLAGGCALNSLANGKLFEHSDVEDIYIQAAAGDAGTALGAALYLKHCVRHEPRDFVMEHALWGPEFGETDIRQAIARAVPGSAGADGLHREVTVETVADDAELFRRTASAVAAGDVVGWYQGRSEWGPRALGNRSILGDPRRSDMKEILNLKIKRREPFRPFAPSILEEKTGEWFAVDYPDPFMLKVYPFRPEKSVLVPAVSHVDGTGRLQTVSQRSNERYWRLIQEFDRQTGVPMVLNTSFNENEPIVNSPAEALDCFLRTRMDLLVLGRIVLRRRSAHSPTESQHE